MMPGEKNLGRLAGEQAERRDAPHGVAGEKRAERLAEAQAGARGHAHPPAGGADREAQPCQRKDRHEAPADALNAVENVGDACTPDDVGEEDGAAERAGDGEQMPAEERLTGAPSLSRATETQRHEAKR